jgi:hypothetical protein
LQNSECRRHSRRLKLLHFEPTRKDTELLFFINTNAECLFATWQRVPPKKSKQIIKLS